MRQRHGTRPPWPPTDRRRRLLCRARPRACAQRRTAARADSAPAAKDPTPPIESPRSTNRSSQAPSAIPTRCGPTASSALAPMVPAPRPRPETATSLATEPRWDSGTAFSHRAAPHRPLATSHERVARGPPPAWDLSALAAATLWVASVGVKGRNRFDALRCASAATPAPSTPAPAGLPASPSPLLLVGRWRPRIVGKGGSQPDRGHDGPIAGLSALAGCPVSGRSPRRVPLAARGRA